jgi:hypothetical protein
MRTGQDAVGGARARGGRGPLGLALLLALGCSAARASAGQDGGRGPARFPASDQQDAWRLLRPAQPALPLWARTLARTLPETTALGLDLDAQHRLRHPLGPVLAARLRRAVAEANRCSYGIEIAEGDLVRAGLSLAEARAVDELPEAERTALAFARALSLAASEITDGEVARLIELFGPDDTVAIVHGVAHANFQDRIFLALGLVAEPGGPLPPVAALPAARSAPPRKARAEQPPAASAGQEPGAAPASWAARGADELRAALAGQEQRTPRIGPADEVRLARLPRPERARVAGSQWGKVSLGYQPGLTSAWFRTMGAFEREAGLEQVFATTLFWVVTRTNECFY